METPPAAPRLGPGRSGLRFELDSRFGYHCVLALYELLLPFNTEDGWSLGVSTFGLLQSILMFGSSTR